MKKHTRFCTLAMAVILLLGLRGTPAAAYIDANIAQSYSDSDSLAEPEGIWALDDSPENQASWDEKRRYLYPFAMAFREALSETDDWDDWYGYAEILERGEEIDDPAFRAYKAYKEAYNAWESMNNAPAETPAPTETPAPAADDVTISASAFGFGGMVTVDVTFGPDGIIKALSVSAPDETPTIGGRAAESGYTSRFIGVSSGDDVDGLSGATYTSAAVKNAVNDAVKTFRENKADNISGVEEPAAPASTAYASTQAVNVDGRTVTFECYALKDEKGNATNYIKLRDLAALLNGSAAQFQVGWDGSVTITTGAAYTPNGSELSTPYSGDRSYQESGAATRVNGREESLSAIVLNDDQGGGYTYYQLRDLGRALGFNVGWAADRGIFVETDKPYDPAN